MSTESIKGRAGTTIATIRTDSDGKKILKTFAGNFIAEYDPKFDVTRDKTGNRLGKGNILMSLLPED